MVGGGGGARGISNLGQDVVGFGRSKSFICLFLMGEKDKQKLLHELYLCYEILKER